MKTSTLILATALMAAPATLAGSHAMDDGSEYGHCTAYEHSEPGRENGNASQAEPFAQLEENASAANESVDEYCSDVEHPSEHAAAAADEHRPEDPGQADEHRPDDPGRPDHAGEDDGDDEDADEEHRRDDEHRPDEDERGPP